MEICSVRSVAETCVRVPNFIFFAVYCFEKYMLYYMYITVD